MFEEKSYENLLQEKLGLVSTDYDKREGSVIFDALAPNSAEMAQVYITLEWMFNQMFGDTASRESLIKIAKDTRGMEPYGSTYGIRKGEFNIAVPDGARFSIEDVNYYVLQAIEEPDRETGKYTYQMVCESKGEIGNRYSGNLIPIDYISGLVYAKLTDILIPGEEEEGTEEFRERWRNSFNNMAFGGNREDYKKKIKAIDGVGGCKCYRTTNEDGELVGGYVRCVVIASHYYVPSPILISAIQENIDPTQTGSGDGLAPIGHYVTVAPVKETTIDIQSEFTFMDDYSYEECEEQIRAAINGYFNTLAKDWEDSIYLIVRISAIENVLLDIKGLIDIANTKLNGVAVNMALDTDAIPALGIVSKAGGS